MEGGYCTKPDKQTNLAGKKLTKTLIPKGNDTKST